MKTIREVREKLEEYRRQEEEISKKEILYHIGCYEENPRYESIEVTAVVNALEWVLDNYRDEI